MTRGGATFLLEIGTEEIPDRMLAAGQADLAREMAQALEPLGILGEEGRCRGFSTPRRLGVSVGPVQARQADRDELATGPSVKVAFAADGRPTKAAEGFARGQGVAVEALQRIETSKGEYVAVQQRIPGRAAADLLAEVCPQVVRTLRFAKMMRWGAGGFRFVRPIRWIVALLDGEIVPFDLAGVSSGRRSRGHRSSAHAVVDLAAADAYVEALRQAGVQVDPEARRRLIRTGLDSAAAAAGGELLPDDGLLEILVQMTESPSVIHGDFPEEYLDLPREVLVTAMRHHQRYFSVLQRDPSASAPVLRPAFLAVLNRAGDPEGSIRRGHEWVLQARLADARFFWEEDRRTPLAARLPRLDRVIFQETLGSFGAKVARITELARALGQRLGAAPAVVDSAARAAQLCKCDLTTAMVGEFPELQGIMGGIYAAGNGEGADVAEAIYDHHRPAGASDDLPRSASGRLLALADRLDTLAGYFAIGAEPTGTRDPLALRRAALGVARILWESPWYLSTRVAVDHALAGFPEGVRTDPGTGARLCAFLAERLRHVAQSAGHRYDSVAAVSAVQDDDMRDARERLQALTALRADAAHEEAFRSMSGASKRIRNLLRGQEAGDLDPAALVEAPEVELHRGLQAVEGRLDGLMQARDYLQALRDVASLRPAVDGFLGSSRSEGVLVLAEDRRLRSNRLALLERAGGLFARVADFSEIVVEGAA